VSDSSPVDFQVRRDDLRQCRFEPAPAADEIELAPGEVILRVASFGFTANNVTYGVVGEAFSYWNFFPAPPGWGRIPVWGFGDVIRSQHEDVAEGERLFGYFPMSTHLVVQANPVTPTGLQDASPHRSGLAPVYNRYVRVREDPGYEERYESHQMLFWPLFMTAFVLDDYLSDEGFFGAEALVLSSASSKTAFGLAFLLSRNRSSEVEVIGLTSSRNVPFVEGLGCYDQVVPYDRIASLPAERPVAFIDMAGNGALLSQLHHHYGDRMKHSCLVGVTHWERGERDPDLPGPAPTFFFAPTRIEKRIKDWGPVGLQERFGKAWQPFRSSVDGWIRLVHGRGPEAVARVYRDTLEGRSRPDEGHVLSL
jgi:hypothetical protein